MSNLSRVRVRARGGLTLTLTSNEHTTTRRDNRPIQSITRIRNCQPIQAFLPIPPVSFSILIALVSLVSLSIGGKPVSLPALGRLATLANVESKWGPCNPSRPIKSSHSSQHCILLILGSLPVFSRNCQSYQGGKLVSLIILGSVFFLVVLCCPVILVVLTIIARLVFLREHVILPSLRIPPAHGGIVSLYSLASLARPARPSVLIPLVVLGRLQSSGQMDIFSRRSIADIL